MPKTLEEALTDHVRDTLGAQLLQIMQLQVQVTALTAENAALKAAVAPMAEGVT